ncbi:MAG: tRNA (N6-isopentenyl adenosine(37)-C2)-methylthiotransferase MiaB [Candidatus Altimarinota bacterium]
MRPIRCEKLFMAKTFYIKTFGCQMNYADSEKINMILLSAGMRKVIDPTKADILIMNTCSVRQKGEDRVFGFINEVSRYHKKNHTGIHPLFGITGCMVRKSGMAKRYLIDEAGNMKNEFYKRHGTRRIELINDINSLLNYDDELFLRSQSIDFTFRIEEVTFLTKILSLILGEDIGNDAKWNEYLAVRQYQENPASANIIIQTGCDNFCTFCIVPYTRGRETSRSQDDIVSEIREVVLSGTKEVTLLGQNVNSYGKETRAKLWNSEELTWASKNVKTPFRELLEEVNKIEGLDRIRFTSSNPHDMTKDILDAHFELPKMGKYLHFALQSGSDTMLKRMNRKHTYLDFKNQVQYLRSRDPLFSISTDIIVGFPGETLEEFEATIHAMRECDFDFAYIARYSPRSGTLATDKYEDDISPIEKAKRWNILNDMLQSSVQNRSKLMIGREDEILISGRGKFNDWVGRTKNFKEVYIPESSEVKIGDIVKVKITELDGWVLRGNLL